MNTRVNALAWYRDPYRWLVIAFPLTAVVGGLITLVLAVRSFDGLVVDDYYKRGLEINRVLSHDAQAAALGLTSAVSWDRGRGLLYVTVHQATGGPTLPTMLNIDLIYATRTGLDRRVLARQLSGGRYTAATPDLAAGHWYIHLSSADWRLTNSVSVAAH